MFVICQLEFEQIAITYKRVQEVKTLEEAEDYLKEHAGDGNQYTVMLE